MLKVLRAGFGTLPLEDITYARVKEFALKLRQMPSKIHTDRPQTPATCNRKLALLRHILRMAWKEGLIEKLPAAELFPEDNERDRILTEEEFESPYEAATDHCDTEGHGRLGPRSCQSHHRPPDRQGFARCNKPSLDTLRVVVTGAPTTSRVTPVSHGPGLASASVLSARKDYMEEDGARWPHRSSKPSCVA